MNVQFGAHDRKLPSMKSRISILTLLGLNFRAFNASAVTNGYLLKSSNLSCGNMSVLCCHEVSFRALSPEDPLEPYIFRTWCRVTCTREVDLRREARRVEHVSWAKSCRNIRVTSGESIGWWRGEVREVAAGPERQSP